VSWDNYPIVQHADPAYVELAETGWEALTAWVAGPDHVIRIRAPEPSGIVRWTWTTPDGSTGGIRTRTAAEQTEIEEDLNSYLADAGIPPRPAGFRWFIRLPDRFGSARNFWSAVNRVTAETARPAEAYAVLTSQRSLWLGPEGAV